ncbi:MAG: type I restriction enzyme R subunit [Cyclobacteriaceae bacterium]|jgi:type I restriction enzyme R subunit
MTFTSETAFEEALIQSLTQKGWENKVIKYPTERDLIDNWAHILFENNRGIDRLNDFPLTNGEMDQILEQITELRTPLKLNGFINGKSVAIKRDNPDDKAHLGKEISLDIYDRHEIAGGRSKYQIIQQPQFKSKSKILNDRRGDLMLLINGMPVIHIELKKSGIPISQAYHQIEKYSRQSIFTGIFSLVQVFVAMSPEETKYFANAGPDGKFNSDFYFNWADINNEPLNNWQDIASSFLSIPMAHQLIGFYTVPDNTDGVLKVMRSYQYYAARAISDRVAKNDWTANDSLGGYIWHTTGSGKTMTSFKSAQLIANSKDADKVIFLMDRIELGTQSLNEYRGFADEGDDIQGTENTDVLITKLKSDKASEVLIVTSIQKMSNIKDEEGGLNAHDVEIMNSKRIVFIIDEAHRSTFGDMLLTIKDTFPSAIFFGFTGTPIQNENQKKMNTTSSVFGNELHRYSIADGIRDGNVLGFDPYKVMTYRDKDLREAVALTKAKASTVKEALAVPAKRKVFNKYMKEVSMAGFINSAGKYIQGIEDYLPKSQYERDEHCEQVVNDIIDNWMILSEDGKFHAIFATSSIADAITYFHRFRNAKPDLKITALFDPHIDNEGNTKYKEEGLVEIITAYNELFDQDFKLATHGKFKKDIADRLAHKKAYARIEKYPEEQLDILIVVDQMLTGFDSKWVNTLYLDKVLQYENIIQAFSRTNRLFNHDEKPHGTIRYYRKPHTMEQNIERAIKLYSGDKVRGLFVEKLPFNLRAMNHKFEQITQLFQSAGVENFEKLPIDLSERGRFASLFKHFNLFLEAARLQRFKWSQLVYDEKNEEGVVTNTIELNIDENTYLILVLRYKELFSETGGGGGISDVAYEIEGYITEINTDKIDADYMNTRFEKYLRTLNDGNQNQEDLQETLDELHKTFASLTQEEQKFAGIFIRDIQRGDAQIIAGKSFKDYIIEYQSSAKSDQIHKISQIFGLDETKLRAMIASGVTENNLNEFGRFDELKETINKAKAKEYIQKMEGKEVPQHKVNIKAQALLKQFVIEGGFEI